MYGGRTDSFSCTMYEKQTTHKTCQKKGDPVRFAFLMVHWGHRITSFAFITKTSDNLSKDLHVIRNEVNSSFAFSLGKKSL